MTAGFQSSAGKAWATGLILASAPGKSAAYGHDGQKESWNCLFDVASESPETRRIA
jgi:hypothetical protein